MCIIPRRKKLQNVFTIVASPEVKSVVGFAALRTVS
jgi:hypothetical protein